LSPSARGPSAKPDRPGRAPLAGLPVTFLGSFPDPATRLDPARPEIAFVGRSNVGKSSLLNALTGRKGLARVSATPGKTQHMNVFQLPAFYLVDLPGYGWARASQAARGEFRRLLDIRHAPSADDRAVQELLVRTGRPCLTVLTKADKLPRARRAEATRARTTELGLDPADLLVTSVRTGEGVGDLGESILAAVEG